MSFLLEKLKLLSYRSWNDEEKLYFADLEIFYDASEHILIIKNWFFLVNENLIV